MGYTLDDSGYSDKLYDHTIFPKLVDNTVSLVKGLQPKLGFEAIAIRGNSGAAVGWPVSYFTGIPIILVRKGETTHGDPVEGPRQYIQNYIFLDDFISSGSSAEAVINALNKKDLTCTGCVLYNQKKYNRSPHKSWVGDGKVPLFYVDL